MGFMGYSIFNVAFFFDPGVQEQYRYNCLSIMLIVLAGLLACMHAYMFPLVLLMAAKKCLKNHSLNAVQLC